MLKKQRGSLGRYHFTRTLQKYLMQDAKKFHHTIKTESQINGEDQ